jgi:hypothetical protein
VIFQRLAKSLREQDWFVVLIEILIVVVGLFLGLQANNWNEDRKSAIWEQRFLTDLAIEFRSNREQLLEVVEWQRRRGAALDKALELAQSAERANLQADINAAYSLAMSSNRTFFPTTGVYLSALSTGSIEDVRSTALRYSIMDIYERAYPRLVYNGEIYDERSDRVSWDNRQDINSGDNSVLHKNFTDSENFVGNIRFLSDQNRIYLGLAESTLKDLDGVISDLSGSSK